MPQLPEKIIPLESEYGLWSKIIRFRQSGDSVNMHDCYIVSPRGGIKLRSTYDLAIHIKKEKLWNIDPTEINFHKPNLSPMIPGKQDRNTKDFIAWIRSNGTTNPRFLNRKRKKKTLGKSKKLRINFQTLDWKHCDQCSLSVENEMFHDEANRCMSCFFGQNDPQTVLQAAFEANVSIDGPENEKFLDFLVKQSKKSKQEVIDFFKAKNGENLVVKQEASEELDDEEDDDIPDFEDDGIPDFEDDYDAVTMPTMNIKEEKIDENHEQDLETELNLEADLETNQSDEENLEDDQDAFPMPINIKEEKIDVKEEKDHETLADQENLEETHVEDHQKHENQSGFKAEDLEEEEEDEIPDFD